MTHKEICAIIKACVNSKVKEFVSGDLKISFFDPKGEPQAATIPQVIQDPELLKSKIKQEDRLTFEKLELKVKEDELEQMLIEDPAQYERLLLARELEDSDAAEKARGSS